MTELASQYYDRLPHDRPLAAAAQSGAAVAARARRRSRSSNAAHGEVGSLLHVDLANRSSCVAIHTEDLAVHHDDGFVLLGRGDQGAVPRGCSLDAEDLASRAQLHPTTRGDR